MGAFFVRATVGSVFVLVIAACSTSTPVGVGGNGGANNTTTLAEYDIALKKWQSVGPAHYRIVVTHTCECNSELQRATRVTVLHTPGSTSETIEEVVDAATLQPVSTERRTSVKSVDGLLVLIAQGLALNPQDSRITYDFSIGYPLSINIDPVESITGDEIVYKVTSFETLP